MKKVFYLNSCSTCKKIMSSLDLAEWEHREIKSTPITAKELEELYAITKSYEALFSKRSQQIKIRGIDLKELKDEDYAKLILEHYSFLKRPVFIDSDKIFVGSEKSNIEKLINYFS